MEEHAEDVDVHDEANPIGGGPEHGLVVSGIIPVMEEDVEQQEEIQNLNVMPIQVELNAVPIGGGANQIEQREDVQNSSTRFNPYFLEDYHLANFADPLEVESPLIEQRSLVQGPYPEAELFGQQHAPQYEKEAPAHEQEEAHDEREEVPVPEHEQEEALVPENIVAVFPNGSAFRFITEKQLTWSDINKRRLALPRADLHKLETTIGQEEEANLTVYDLEDRSFTVSMKTQRADGSRDVTTKVLTNGWPNFVRSNNFQVGDIIRLWSFKRGDETCFLICPV